jgi:hypothetical protein
VSLPISADKADNLWSEAMVARFGTSASRAVGFFKNGSSISLPDIEAILPLRRPENYRVLFLLPEAPTYAEFKRVLALSSGELEAEVRAKANAESEGAWDAIFAKPLLLPISQDQTRILWSLAKARAAADRRDSVNRSDIEAAIPLPLSEKFKMLSQLPETPTFAEFERVSVLTSSELDANMPDPARELLEALPPNALPPDVLEFLGPERRVVVGPPK